MTAVPTTPLVMKVATAIATRRAQATLPRKLFKVEKAAPTPIDLKDAQTAIAACEAEAMLEALNRLTSAVGTMLNVYLADEEDDIELCHDTEHHLAILELRDAFNAGTKVERALLTRLDGKPREQPE